MKTRTLLEGVGGAFLLLFSYYQPFLLSSNSAIYHHGLPVTNLVGGLLVDLVCLSGLTMLFLFGIRYLPEVAERTFHALFAGLMLWRIVDAGIDILNGQQYPMAHWEHMRIRSCLAVLLLSVLLALLSPRVARPTMRAICMVVAAFAFSAIWIVPRLLYLALASRTYASASPVHTPTLASNGSKQRIVWILFDELSFDQTFDHRPPGINLPNFDQLRSESVSFSNLKPAGFYTDRIITSLFLGSRIERTRSTVDGDLLYFDESEQRWRAYDASATLFGLAQRNGWSSGVDGWYIPYCHILAPVLSDCSWEPGLLPIEMYGASEEKSVFDNSAVLPLQFLATLTHQNGRPANAHIQGYVKIMSHARALIENNQIQFVFLHFPVPHPFGMYDRKHHTLRPGGTYLDNLVLADDILGELLHEISLTSSASQTTLIASSDHSWRIGLWRPNMGWSPEEERASRGVFDDRPVLLIHFPGELGGRDIDAPLPEMLEHDVIEAMLNGHMSNSEELIKSVSQIGH